MSSFTIRSVLPIWDSASKANVANQSVTTDTKPNQIKIALTIAQARAELNVDELRKAVADSAQIATESVKKYLKKYIEELQKVVSLAEDAAIKTYDALELDETTYPELTGPIPAYTDSEREVLVLDAYKNVYQSELKRLNMRMPMGDKIQQKYLNQFNVGLKLK